MCMNEGKCINDNLCDCENSKFTGKDCTERYKLRRNSYLNASLVVISLFFLLITIATMAVLFKFKNHEIVKAGSYDFLNIILIGLLFNFAHVLTLTKYEYTDIEGLH
ncbi:hypothetical protein PIROE2DRAFT_17762 [Piromyces sp. E2]|nr:hypothetical protein PIROE2DRAFT_17762 [Piromyces sp. E2]|eukprot:OUM57306.1 hypothetical protein PIROE2DRAFT_17762 [Piromyces sp. E2]